jgi:D-alanyl-D-alanine carboxypeptidase
MLPTAAAGLAAVFLWAPATGQEIDLERLESVADSVAHHHIASDVAPGISVAVARDGEILFQKGYGLADAEMGAAAGPETVYRIGSITKPRLRR